MNRKLVFLFVFLALTFNSKIYATDYSFADFAEDAGLTGDEEFIYNADNKGITNLYGLANNYDNLQVLSLALNQLSHIESEEFAGLVNLQALYLGSNNISNDNCEQGMFAELTGLQSLSLGGNPITYFKQGMFDGLDTLQMLSSTNGQISRITKTGFQGLQNITFLKLSHNQIADIEHGSFDSLSHLEGLVLSENQISEVKEGEFSKLTDLKDLYLSENCITSIESGDFEGLESLESLVLASNQITDIEGSDFEGLDELQFLSLFYNRITSIERSDFESLAKLEKLNLGNNQIVSLEDDSFKELSHLKHLSLSSNRDLKNLNLRSANFLNLDWFSVSDCPIERVFLNESMLTQISFDALMIGDYSHTISHGLAEIFGVKSIDFSRVDFTDILDLSKMYGMDDLEELVFADATNLDGDEVAKLLSELDSLNYLDVTGEFLGWDQGIQDELLAWDNIEGNTLVVPEPITLALFGIGGLLLRKR